TTGDRSDVSWITVQETDYEGELIIAKGVMDEIYRMNPIVAMNHRYDLPAAGRSIWRKSARNGELEGIKAKTLYPARPAYLAPEGEWAPDSVWEMIKAGLLLGKSVGIVPVEVREPTPEEEARHPGVKQVIARSQLIEYSVCAVPVQKLALVESVSKSVQCSQT